MNFITFLTKKKTPKGIAFHFINIVQGTKNIKMKISILKKSIIFKFKLLKMMIQSDFIDYVYTYIYFLKYQTISLNILKLNLRKPLIFQTKKSIFMQNLNFAAYLQFHYVGQNLSLL